MAEEQQTEKKPTEEIENVEEVSDEVSQDFLPEIRPADMNSLFQPTETGLDLF